MTLKDLTDAYGWIKTNGKRKITPEEKAWAKQEIDRAETISDLIGVVLSFINTAK